MIFTRTADDIRDCGFYRIRRETQGYSLWWNHPKNLHLLARAKYLEEVVADAEQHRLAHSVPA